ncbi:MAG: ATP-binding cassette domain-containing protein [Desulfurococcaceae archaeon]|nr:ATP-binding cassette domain-containing protein [Desulfurococcaceae archaeon]
MEDVGKSVEFVDVYASYNDSYAAENVNLTLTSPFYALLLGPNGAGKTTLIKVLVGLLRPLRGYVRVYGRDPFRDRREVSKLLGYLPQPGTSRPSPFMTVRELVAVTLLSTRRPPRVVGRDVEEAVEEALRAMEIEGLSSRRLSELSGGQLQRALIASVIVRRPKLLVLDEPLASLDFDAKCDLAGTLYKLHKEYSVDVLMSTHEMASCIRYEPLVILLNRRVVAYGPASRVLTPDNLRRTYPTMSEVAGVMILGEDHAVRSAR